MAHRDSMPAVSARIGGFVARHPKLVAVLLASILLLAVQGGAAAVTMAEPAAEGSAYLGPDPEDY